MHKQTFLYLLPICLLPLQASQLPLYNDANDYQEEMKIDDSHASSLPNNQPDKPSMELESAPLENQPASESIDIAGLIDDANKKFQIYLEVYKNSFVDGVTDAFSLLTRYSTYDLDSISDTIDRLTQCLRSLQKVKRQTPKLFSLLYEEANPLHLAEEKLQALTNQLKKTIGKEKRQKSHTLDHTLKVLDMLTSLDDYRSKKESNKNEVTFTLLHNTHKDDFYVGLDDTKEAMRIGSYGGVLQSIQNLQRAIEEDKKDMVNKNKLKAIQAAVELELHSIMAGVRKEVMLSEGARAKKNKAIEINDKLSRLEKAMRVFCPPANQLPVLGEEIQERLWKRKKIVDMQLVEWISDFIKETNNCIVSCNFLQAEEQLEQIRGIIAIFNENIVTLTQVKKNADSPKPEKAITDGIKRLEMAIEKELKARKEHYRAIAPGKHQFNPYFSNPPKEICEKLKQAFDKNARYKSTHSAIKNDIFKKLRELMIRNLNSHKKAKKDFNLCRSILVSLPAEWALNLEQELTQQEKSVQKEEEIENDHFQKVTKRGDIAEMSTYLIALEEKKDRAKASQIRATIKIKANAQLNAFRKSLLEEDILTACTELQKLALLSTQYGETVPFLVHSHTAAEKELSSSLKKKADFVNTKLKTDKKSLTPVEMQRIASYAKQLHAYESYRITNS